MELIYFILIFALYFLPTITAMMRRHRDDNAIFMMNLLLGWTVLFWLWSLFWSLTGNVKGANARTV